MSESHWSPLEVTTDSEPTYPLLSDGKPSDGRGHHACEQCLTDSGIHCPATVEVGGTYLCRTCQRDASPVMSDAAAEYAALLEQITAAVKERDDPVRIAGLRAAAAQFRRDHAARPAITADSDAVQAAAAERYRRSLQRHTE